MSEYNYKFEQKLIFLVGNIGSGKTTYVENIKNGYVIISRDKIRYMLGGGNYIFDPKLEPAIWLAELELFVNLLKTGVNIIIDEVNCSPYMRSRYLNEALDIFSQFKYHITAVVFPKISKKEAVRRRLSSPHGNFDQKTWENVYDRFNKQYQEPSIIEGFNHIIWLKNQNGKFIIKKQIKGNNGYE